MASRILLISANRCTKPDPVFPLGLAHLNAALRRAGHFTRWHDRLVDTESLSQAVLEFEPDYVGVSLRNIDDVLIGRQETYFNDLQAICQEVRRLRDCPVILGGSGFSVFPRRLIELSGAEYGIQGEGEASLVSLIASLERGGDGRGIPGVVCRQNGDILAQPAQAGRCDVGLDLADRPAALARHYLQAGGMLNLQTQRGCAHGCCYCTYPLIEGRKHRPRPPEVVAEEMAQSEAHGAKYVYVVDSIFNSSLDHVVRTCEAILRRGLRLQWGCFLRPQGLTAEAMQLMARAGLAHIEFGADSFCDRVLEEYGKGFTFEDVQQSHALARQAGIDCCHFLICGGPGETAETLAATFENSRQLVGAVILAVVGMRIYPGTGLHRRALREGRIQPDTDLLPPTYYLAEGLTAEGLFAELRAFAGRAPNWIVGDPAPAYADLVDRLRRRGVAGPLWSYFALLQRIRPQSVG